ncbi:hypothetical protein SFC65_20315 [Priestia filamentosa]|uniref:TerC family protein n=1 Tax=Priestia filamentosa TaxID=1402861 RepID=UPI003981E41B
MVYVNTSVASAIKTIIIADAIMSIDNVVALAGITKSSIFAIVIGILISIPITIFGSQLILKAMERFPIISHIGSGILAWTAGEMLVSEPKLESILPHDLHFLVPVLLTLLSVGIGYLAAQFKRKKQKGTEK